MSRIRTVKPELFKHEDLFNAEINSKLPLRLAFIGLLTCCDRNGRFKWQPQRLKLDILPYDNIDVATVLDNLAKYEFIKKYEHQGKSFGYIPSFVRHQQINNREAESIIPAPPEQIIIIEPNNKIIQANYTDNITKTNNPVSIPTTNKTKEIKNNQVNHQESSGYLVLNTINSDSVTANIAPKATEDPIQKIFQHWKTIMHHPNAQLDEKRKILIKNALELGYNSEQLCNAISGCSITPHNIGNNNQGQRYDGLHIILRDADQIDRFIHHYHYPPQPMSEADRLKNQNINELKDWLITKLNEGSADEQQ